MNNFIIKSFFIFALLASFFAIPFSCSASNYQQHPSIPHEIWEEAKPYFLPEDHPIKQRLDFLFSQTRLLDSYENLEKNGFRILNANCELDVAVHPDLNGYVIKFYLDSNDNTAYFKKLKLEDTYISEVRLWLLRMAGVNRVQKIIDAHHYHDKIKVPKKWIYPLPLNPEATGPFPKHFILVAEDMQIVNDEENKKCYREEMSPDLLKAFYTVLKEGGFYDSVYIDNNPFCKDGKIAFLDTEEYDRKPVPFVKLLPNLSLANQIFLQQLMTMTNHDSVLEGMKSATNKTDVSNHQQHIYSKGL